MHEIVPSDRFHPETVKPSDWGIDQDCFVRLHEPTTNVIRVQRFAGAGESVSWQHDGSDDRLVLTFRRVDATRRPGSAIGHPHAWVPRGLRGAMPADILNPDGALRASVRRDVTLARLVSRALGSGTLTSRGFVGAWVDGEPVVEVLDFALGRQYYHFRPSVDARERLDGPVIYLGGTRKGWGHFLTQGLARIWFALEHPEIPVLWDGSRLLPYQQEVLDLIGLRNPQRFLKGPVSCAELIIPFPGLCIGEFALPEFTRAIGRVEPSAQVPGRRVFLSRSALGEALSDDEVRLDELAVRFGFEIFRPEQHTVREQLDAMSSAEAVLGIEGSAFHTPLLLQDRVQTRFWALTRHRGGSGVFEHIRRAKGLRYETLNFSRSMQLGGHRSPIELDVEALEAALHATDGLTSSFESVRDRIERPWSGQTSFETHLQHAQVRPSRSVDVIMRAHLALHDREPDVAALLAAAL
ncbi:glycosyltransferase family 61 protein [Agrococcus terreus]|uniref:glycosyltransferase family 61 protein n=1 Tax=Agrococcus terreus TaxID=574649 RepID=UPI001668FF02|nr:glycosyltransferase 61 family protein [Agrococcus terreus]